MLSELVTLALPVCLAGLLISWHLDALLRPMPVPPWRRPLAALGVHAGWWMLLFALALAVLRRPWCTAANVLALHGVFIIVNNAKYHALREPFVSPDLVFFSDTLKHPRLYLPFLGWRAPLATATGYALALWGGLELEPALTPGGGIWALLAAASLLAACGLLLTRACARHLPHSLRFDASDDLQQLGLVANLCQYARAERADTRAIREAAPFARPPATTRAGHPRPDYIVVQSESFFDARRWYPQLRPELLQHYDVLRSEACQHGRLQIDSWGANTIRTEFEFLSGLSPEQIGVHRFHPYRRLARQGVATLASHLRAQGYRTLCVHPYHGSFYGRDQVLPQLGFDELIDIRSFDHRGRDAANGGPYLGDRALGRYVQALLGQADRANDQPLYIHVISMENHGPLHWERVTDVDAQARLRTPLPPECTDLIAYARHLGNADAMFGGLREALLQRARAGVMCIFGDHVPIMSKVYRALSEPDGMTDYLVWRTDTRSAHTQDPVTLAPSELARVVVEVGGIACPCQKSLPY